MKPNSFNEDVGICNSCRKGEHERCPMLVATIGGSTAFCNCKCGEKPGVETSLGAREGFPRPPAKIRREFRKKFPKHEIDPLGHLF